MSLAGVTGEIRMPVRFGPCFRRHRFGDFEHQLRPVLDSSAIGVGALVGAVLGELLQQIAIGAVHFDAVETRRHRIGRALPEAFDDAGNFLQRQRARLGHVGECSADKRLALGADRRGRDRRLIVLLQADMRDTPDMPELKEDAAAALMDAVRHLAPACNLLLGIDAGRVLIALALLRNLRCLAHQQARGGALAVIFDRQWIGHQAGERPVAGQRRHHQAIGKREGPKLGRARTVWSQCSCCGFPENCR